MKAAVLLFLLVVLGFTAWQRQYFLDELRPELLDEAMAQLKAAGYDVSVTAPAGMDAELVGTVPEAEDQEAARNVVDGIPGLRALREHNHLRIPGRIRLRLEPGTSNLQLSGRLGDVEAGRRLVVALQEIGTVDAVDVDDLVFQSSVTDPSYLESAAFYRLAQAFFEIPGNGELTATEAGIAMKGAATVQAREIWEKAEEDLAQEVHPNAASAAARMVWDSGWPSDPAYDRFRIRAEVTYHPSPFHVPGYQPDAPLPEERLRNLASVLERSEIVFTPETVEAGRNQTGKLEAAARAMQAAGDRVRYVVGGHCLASADGEEAAARQARARAEIVIEHLVALGIAGDQLDAAVFATPDGSGPPEATRFHKVEIRIR